MQERKFPLPSRILHLGNPLRKRHNYLDDDLRLATGTRRRGEYATLSYCWGGYRGFLTEQASLRDRLSCINFYDLPRAFQDAVDVTRRLNIRYLWIDALCIIQDSREDWEREASHMASIYSKCKVRIAASAITDPTQSFFPPKPIVASVRVIQLEGSESNNLRSSLESLPPLTKLRHPDGSSSESGSSLIARSDAAKGGSLDSFSTSESESRCEDRINRASKNREAFHHSTKIICRRR